MEYIDIHCHPNFPEYDKDREEIIQKMKDQKVLGICAGTDFDKSVSSVELANKHHNLYATIGLHPTHAHDGFDYDKYMELGKNNKKDLQVSAVQGS
ncbi:MAG: TatD family hydrolase [Patescibacteria group bacterium]